MLGEYICLTLYVASILIVFILHLKRNLFDAGSFLLFVYLVCSVVSFVLYSAQPRVWSITLLPFVYLFILFLISIKPILQFDISRILSIQKPPMTVINVVSLLYILCTLLSIKGSFSNIGTRIVLLITDTSAGQVLYSESAAMAESSGKSLSNIFAVLANILYNFEVLVFFYLLTVENKTFFQKCIANVLPIPLFIGLISSLLAGGRSEVVSRGMLIAATYFLLKTFMKPKIKKIIKNIGLVIIVIVVVPFFTLTASRFGTVNGGIESSIMSYTGQNILNFNTYAFDNNGIRYGDRTIPLFKKLFLFEDVPDNFIERRQKYPNLKINDEKFVTYIGDFVLDFGPLIAFLIISLFSIFVNIMTKIRGLSYPFYKLILLHFLLSIIAQGIFLYRYADISGNLVAFFYFFMFMFLWFYNSLKHQHKLN